MIKKKNNQHAVRICFLISFYTKFNNFRNPKQNAKIVVFRCPLCRNTMFRQLDTTARLVSENSESDVKSLKKKVFCIASTMPQRNRGLTDKFSSSARIDI